MVESATSGAGDNINDGDCDAVAVAIHKSDLLQFPLYPLFLTVVITYVGAPPPTRASIVPVATIVRGQTSN